MERFLMDELVAWKDKRNRKPLILNGARQVGKTWLLKEFGRRHFKNVAYVSLDSNEMASALFDGSLDARRIISNLSLLANQPIVAGETLVVIDEIQSNPRAITSLKYFCEDATEYAIAAAGSLLGISSTEGTGYPVGKVDTLDLYPLSFREYLDATGDGALRELLDSTDTQSINVFTERATQALKGYFVVGGMPAVVDEFAQTGDFAQVRRSQTQIAEDYVRDFAKHMPSRLYPKAIDAWESVPAHLSHENKKFIFGRIREGARAKDYEDALVWLSQAGLIEKVPRVSKPAIPLRAYSDHRAFKVFMLDIGLLGALSGLDPSSIAKGNAVFTEFKGALTEQFVCQQLLADCGIHPFYWSAENSIGELDFLVQRAGEIYAIEVKAEENLRAKSLRSFKAKHVDVHALRFSLSGYREQDWMRNIPLYAMSNIELWDYNRE